MYVIVVTDVDGVVSAIGPFIGRHEAAQYAALNVIGADYTICELAQVVE